jgi:hypothetical protein
MISVDLGFGLSKPECLACNLITKEDVFLFPTKLKIVNRPGFNGFGGRRKKPPEFLPSGFLA